MSCPKGRGNFWRGNLDDLQRLLEGGIRKNELEEAISSMPVAEKLDRLIRLNEASASASPTHRGNERGAHGSR